MIKAVTPQVFIIAKTQVEINKVRDWLDTLNVSSNVSDLVYLAGKRCYLSYDVGQNLNVKQVRRNSADFIQNILQSGHGSVLEHVYYTFAIENVSRVFTAEFNRHRAGMAVSEGSMRFIRTTDLSYVMPPSLTDLATDDAATLHKKARTRAIFHNTFAYMADVQKELWELWDIDNVSDFDTKKKLTSLFRRLIGMGVATGGVWTGNIRALRHIFTMRCAPAAEEEICMVASMMLQLMMTHEPDLFADFARDDAGYWRPKFVKV